MGTAWRSRWTQGAGEMVVGGGEGRCALERTTAGSRPKFLEARPSQSARGELESVEERSARAAFTRGASVRRQPSIISSLANHSAHSPNSRDLIPHLILSRGTPPGAAAATPAPRSPSRHPRRPLPLPCHTRTELSPTVQRPVWPVMRPCLPPNSVALSRRLRRMPEPANVFISPARGCRSSS